jgi:serine/threonine protein phosphatase 1
MRTFVIGDIHGGYKALVQVLERARFDYENDKLISLGDVVDGWSETAESIEELMKIKNLIYIKGNHDEWVERFLKQFLDVGPSSSMQMWAVQGGESTIYSYEKNPNLVDKHLEFLSNALLYYIDEDNRIFLHAGFDPDTPLDKQYFLNVGQDPKENAVFYWDRKFWRHLVSRDKIGNQQDVWEKWNEIYIGHTPTGREYDHMKPVNLGNVWNMDTGAGYNGSISMMDLDTKEIFQSDPVYRLYPEEMGRNETFLAKDENIFDTE